MSAQWRSIHPVLLILIVIPKVSASSLTFLHSKQKFEVLPGASVSFSCQVADETAAVFLRHRFSQGIPQYQVHLSKKVLQQGQAFSISNVGYHDNGVYSCLAISDDGRQATKEIAELLVINLTPVTQSVNTSQASASNTIRGSRPYILFDLDSPVRVKVTSTKELTVNIQLKGLQPIETKWLKDDKEIYSGYRIKTAEDGKQLIIKPPFSSDDSGSYEIMACNVEGCTHRGLQIQFDAAPNKNFKPVKHSLLLLCIGGAVVVFCVVCVILILLILKWKGIIFKSLTQRLKEENTKTMKQFKRGTTTKSGAIWSWNEGDAGSSGTEEEVTDYADLPFLVRHSRIKEQMKEKPQSENSFGMAIAGSSPPPVPQTPRPQIPPVPQTPRPPIPQTPRTPIHQTPQPPIPQSPRPLIPQTPLPPIPQSSSYDAITTGLSSTTPKTLMPGTTSSGNSRDMVAARNLSPSMYQGSSTNDGSSVEQLYDQVSSGEDVYENAEDMDLSLKEN